MRLVAASSVCLSEGDLESVQIAENEQTEVERTHTVVD